MVTGEAIPVEKGPDDRVIGATVNGTGSFIMRAERVGRDTLLAQIVNMVGQAQRSRAPIQRLADVVSGYFVPIVVAIAIGTAIVWAAVGPEPRMAHAIVNAVAVLIIACPCALGLATPMSIMVATGRGATVGVLFRDAEAIEVMRQVDTLVVDKTGTLTVGKPRLMHVKTASGWDEPQLLRFAATLEAASEHPLAAAIVQGALERAISPAKAEQFESITGKGVKGRVEGRAVTLGNRRLMEDEGIPTTELATVAEELRTQGQTVMFVAVDGRMVGLIGVADPIKETTVEAVRQLHGEGIRLVMLTGDNRTTAEAVARQLGIDDVIAEVLPDRKAEVVKRLQQEGSSSRWPVTASTTRRRWRRRRSGLRWAPGRTSRWKVRVSRSSKATCGASSAHGVSAARRWGISNRICSSRSSTTRSVCRSQRACCTRSSDGC
jgi:Cu+-exporting ATPase